MLPLRTGLRKFLPYSKLQREFEVKCHTDKAKDYPQSVHPNKPSTRNTYAQNVRVTYVVSIVGVVLYKDENLGN